MTRAIVLAVLFVAACGDRGTVRAWVTENQNHPFSGTQLEVVVADDVALFVEKAPAGRGPRTTGTTIEAPLEGRRCLLRVLAPHDETVTDAPATIKNPTSRDFRTRTYRGADVELACSDGPAPGSPSSMKGGRSLVLLPWCALFLALGIAVGFLVRRGQNSKSGGAAIAAVGAILAGIAGVITSAWMLADGMFVVSWTIVFAVFGIGGIVAVIQWPVSKPTSIAGVVALTAGALAHAFAVPAVSFGGSIILAICSVGAWVVAQIVCAIVPSRSGTAR